jgi:probable F420-dependent oxidoreductase
MKFAIGFATIGASMEPGGLASLAKTAEELGFESIWSVEHPAIPEHYISTYPYSPTGRIEAPPQAPLPDPFTPLAYAAAITTRLRLATGVCLLPHYHPIQLAKICGTLDTLSGGRLMLGVGVGWLREEFQALGQDFDNRAARARETVTAMRSLWTNSPSEFHGRFFDWPPVYSSPKPVQTGGVPIHVGGHTELAAKRAARYGNGFFPAVAGPEALAPLLDTLRAECDKLGRDYDEIEISAGATQNLGAAVIRDYEKLGVSRVFVVPDGSTQQEVRDGLVHYAETVMAEVGADQPEAVAQ